MNEIARTPELIAAEIGAIRNQTKQVVLNAALEIGKRLIEAKALLPHGRWGDYIEGLDYSERTAQNLMRCYEEYGKNPNPQALADLSYTKAVQLLALDGEQREQLMEAQDVDAMSTRQLQAEIDRMRREAAERQVTIEQLQADLETEVDRGNALTADLQKERAERERLEDGTRDALAGAEKAREEAAQERKKAALAMDTMKAAKDEATALRRQLAEATTPVVETVTETVETVPEAVEKELERLREIAAKAPNARVIAFRTEFEHMVAQFDRLRGLLEAMEAEGLPETAKYRAAARKAALNMAARLESGEEEA